MDSTFVEFLLLNCESTSFPSNREYFLLGNYHTALRCCEERRKTGLSHFPISQFPFTLDTIQFSGITSLITNWRIRLPKYILDDYFSPSLVLVTRVAVFLRMSPPSFKFGFRRVVGCCCRRHFNGQT